MILDPRGNNIQTARPAVFSVHVRIVEGLPSFVRQWIDVQGHQHPCFGTHFFVGALRLESVGDRRLVEHVGSCDGEIVVRGDVSFYISP